VSAELSECEAKALSLPASDRAALAERLIASLDHLDDAENERLWAEEAERRYQAYKAGRLTAKPAEEALQQARARLR
jgi:putative addiction module component (TIGR02574 family)